MKAIFEHAGKKVEVDILDHWDTYAGPVTWLNKAEFSRVLEEFGYEYTYYPDGDTFEVAWEKGKGYCPGVGESEDGETLYPLWSFEISATLIKP